MQHTALRIRQQGDFGVVIDGFDPEPPNDVREIKRAVYRDRIAVDKGMDLDLHQFVTLAIGFGERLL